MVRILLPLVAGILLAPAWGQGHSAWLALAASAACLAAAIAASWLRPTLRAGVQTLCIMAATGLLGTALTTRRLAATLPLHTRGDVSLEAVVSTEPVMRGRTWRCDLLVTRMAGQALRSPVAVKATLLRDTLLPSCPLRVGSGLRATATLTPPRAWATGTHFDYRRHLRIQGFRAQTFLLPRQWQPTRIPPGRLPLASRITLRAQRLRAAWLTRYRRAGLTEQQYAVTAAMSLGDRSALSPQLRQAYATVGASHVLALSGLHLGIIYGLLTLMLPRRRRFRWLTQGLIICTVWGYVVLVGMPASALRAAVMLTVYAACRVAGRHGVSVNTLALAAVILLTARPLWLYDVGFQLSFAAVLAIVTGYRPLSRLFRPHLRVMRWLWAITVTSLLAQAGTAPLAAYYFGQASLCFLLTNVVALPAATLLLYGAAAFAVALPYATLQQPLAVALGWLAVSLNHAVHLLAMLPGAALTHLRPSAPQVLMGYVLMGGAVLIATCIVRQRELCRLDRFAR